MIWYHLYHLKNTKNIHGGVLLLVKLQAEACTFTKSNTPPWVFSRFLNCTNGTKSRKASYIFMTFQYCLSTNAVQIIRNICHKDFQKKTKFFLHFDVLCPSLGQARIFNIIKYSVLNSINDLLLSYKK